MLQEKRAGQQRLIMTVPFSFNKVSVESDAKVP